MLFRVLFCEVGNKVWNLLARLNENGELLNQQAKVEMLLLCSQLHVVCDTCEVRGDAVTQYGACLNLLVLLTDVQAIRRRQFNLISFDLAYAVDDARRPDLAQEAEMEFLKFHVLFGSVGLYLVFKCRHEVLLDERLDFVVMYEEHGVQELELFLGVSIQRFENTFLIILKELVD